MFTSLHFGVTPLVAESVVLEISGTISTKFGHHLWHPSHQANHPVKATHHHQQH